MALTISHRRTLNREPALMGRRWWASGGPGRAMAFLKRTAEIAEREGHHPDFCLSRWNQVSLSLTTHAIGGLSRNDFVLATKLQAVIRPPTET